MSTNIEILELAVVGIRDNKKLKEFIAYVLKIGNYLNARTPKGKAMSFSIDLLPQLASIKSVGKSKISVMEFLIT